MVEVAVSVSILTILLVGTLAALLQSRRITEGSINQNSATIFVQGYLEQIKNSEFSDLPYIKADGTIVPGVLPVASGKYPINIRAIANENTVESLNMSTGAIPTLSTIVPGATAPTGVENNTKFIQINSTNATPADTLELRLWVWINDISDTTVDATQVRAITLIYQFKVGDGSRSKWFIGTVRTIRSIVPTF